MGFNFTFIYHENPPHANLFVLPYTIMIDQTFSNNLDKIFILQFFLHFYFKNWRLLSLAKIIDFVQDISITIYLI